MFLRLGRFVTRHWAATLLGWLLLTAGLTWVAPDWDTITNDGDLAYLPDDVSSVQAEAVLRKAFDEERAKSQIAVIVFRDDAPLTQDDLSRVAYDAARRLQNAFGVAALAAAKRASQRLEELPPEASGEAALRDQLKQWRTRAEDALNEAILLDSLMAYPRPRTGPGSRWGVPIHNRALLYEHLGRSDEAAADRELALMLSPELADTEAPLPRIAERLPWLDLWTWRDPTFGSKLRSDDNRARLMLLQLKEEFLATKNMELVRFLESELEDVRRIAREDKQDHVRVGLSGSAAVGGDLLLSAQASIRHTEVFTVVLVILILTIVYRSPLLVIVPLLTIFVSLRVSTSIVSLLTLVDLAPGFEWWELKVFTTSKIFIVVILFGAGTDFCLFMISRCREAIGRGQAGADAVAGAVGGVGEAITGSAMTTVVGLMMMAFAEFGKFRFSGPVIGLCLLVTLAACLTLTPALLCLLASWLRPPRRRQASRFWRTTARLVTRRPGVVLLLTLAALAPPAWRGVHRAQNVSYDFLALLSPNAPSRRGADLMRQSFPIGESGPVMVVAEIDRPVLESRQGRDEIARLNYMIHDVESVVAVRSLADPLGETDPNDTAVLLSRDTLEARFARHHQRTAELFLAQTPDYMGRVTRFEVIFRHDPFSPEAVVSLRQLEDALAHIADSDPFWRGAEFHLSGTTAGIRDLALVTRKDTVRIQWLVVGAVLLVLLLIIRRPLVCLYLVASVLLSYFVTVGVIDWSFAALAPGYTGLDWKVPLFLFVILVAVGQDYNVYLVTRVIEEQRQRPGLPGLRTAVARTGGIITSCGIIMAGTFASMTGAFWTSWLRQQTGWTWIVETQYLKGVIQLGAALSFGVLLDTLVVRSILVPAFLALLARRSGRTDPASEETANAIS